MHKWLKHSKIFKVISFFLVAFFVINLTGCGKAQESNGVESGENGGYENISVGTGEDIVGYTIYSQSTFDQMTKNLFMGYLLLLVS